MITLNNIKKTFRSKGNKVEALKVVTLTLPDNGIVILLGESGSGKSTVAMGVERELHARGILCRILDGDNIRAGINSNLGFTAEDRNENIRRIAEVANCLCRQASSPWPVLSALPTTFAAWHVRL